MQRRAFLKFGLFTSSLPIYTVAASPEIKPTIAQDREMSIMELQELMTTGQHSARDFVEYYLQRIQSIDKQGPALNSVIELNPDALKIADARDRERKSKGVRGPLHGIPILLKDNIDTADQMQTTAGSLALLGSPATKDAFLVQKLRTAGAIILGKTNLSEWANFRSTRSSSGWSSRGGQTKNPYVLTRNPCGSSSGSGAAVAANLCAAAVGTETDGSIMCPAATNGIVGIKPTIGLISRSGIIPIAHSQDTAGPMARTVADAALLLNILSGVDSADPVTRQQKTAADYTTYLDKQGLKNARVGVARSFTGFDERMNAILQDCIAIMQQRGAKIIDPANIEHIDDYSATEYEVLLYEFKAGLNSYLAKRGNTRMQELSDIIAFNEQHQDKIMPYFGQEILLAAQQKGPLSEKAYLQALQKNQQLSRQQGIDATLKKHQLDVIITLTGGPAWVTDLVCGDHFSASSTSPAAVAGYPSITVPAGYIHDLPVGISFIGTAFSEAALIRYAYAFEQASLVRRPPTLKPA